MSRPVFHARAGAQLVTGAGVLVFSAMPSFVQAQTPPVAVVTAPKTVRILTVGNSFSGDATRLLPKIVSASGNKLILHTVSIGGGSMAQHWEKAEKLARDKNDPDARYSSKRTLDEELKAEPWDYVTIQQASILSHDVSTYHPYAAKLAAYIKERAPRATLLVHETWAYRADDSRFKPNAAPGEPATQKAMYDSLRASYETIAGELNAPLIPVGDAYYRADTDPVWGYKPGQAVDTKQFAYPAVPSQPHSLHVGWFWKAPAKPTDASVSLATPTAPPATTAPTLQKDTHHSSAAGQYVGACVFYETLYKESVVGNSFVPPGMDKDYARFLQKTAHDAVLAR